MLSAGNDGETSNVSQRSPARVINTVSIAGIDRAARSTRLTQNRGEQALRILQNEPFALRRRAGDCRGVDLTLSRAPAAVRTSRDGCVINASLN
jgi:hypothetical protein